MVNKSETARARQYVLIELFLNVFREKMINDIMFPIIPTDMIGILLIKNAFFKYEFIF